jgi:hypothetical protein
MKAVRLLVAASAATLSLAAVAAGPANPFEQFKGKMKEGLYEYKMEVEMPGMPAGMSKGPMTFQHCITAKDIEEGGFGKGGRDGKGPPKDCEVKNMNVSGNTATYTMECTGEHKMKADNKITFVGNGFDMDMKMQMNQGGQVMNMNQKMQGRLIGPCTK